MIFEPKKFDDLIGNKELLEKVKEWCKSWEKGISEPILIYGPPGVGKTSLAHVIANEMNWEIVELNASDERTKFELRKYIHSATESTISGRKRLIIIDEVECLDRGGIGEVIKILRNTRQPTILIANDPYFKGWKELKINFYEMKKVSTREIYNFLKKLNAEKGFGLENEKLAEIAANSDGDVRSAIIDLIANTISYRNRKINIFQTLGYFFKSKDKDVAKFTLSESDEDLDSIILWLNKNIKNEYEKKENVYAAYEILAIADYFNSIAKRKNYWYLKKYVTEILSYIPVIVKEEKKFVNYSFPSVLKIERNKIEIKKRICEKISKKFHLSKKETLLLFPIIKKIVLMNPSYYGLEGTEIELLNE
ncbi:MAG: AAA family ATPase [Candidatus Micrarchaeia archaeon]